VLVIAMGAYFVKTRGRPPTAIGTTARAGTSAPPALDAGAGAERAERCPAGLLFVPGGSFTMGSPAGMGHADERPQRTVTLDAFCLGRTEVAVAQYGRCVRAGACPTPAPSQDCNFDQPGRTDHPVNCVDWTMAQAYCRWAGGRLPTEAEWEHAARGRDGRLYPWGNAAPSRQLCWDRSAGTCPVGTFPDGASPFGLLDMEGNVAEWVADCYAADAYAQSGMTNPTVPTAGRCAYHVLRGCGWSNNSPAKVRVALRGRGPATYQNARVGFRCAAGVAR
jgi:formylglycine-generating enzyme required for sulfatase activity